MTKMSYQTTTAMTGLSEQVDMSQRRLAPAIGIGRTSRLDVTSADLVA